jgi:hypothetical protein
MNFNRLTQENSRKYVGYDILFRNDLQDSSDSKRIKRIVCRKILRVSRTGKTIYINYPALGNKLQVISRDIDVILDEEDELMKQLEEIRRRKEEERIEEINKLREQHRNKILAKIRYLAYELENFDKLTHEEFLITEL